MVAGCDGLWSKISGRRVTSILRTVGKSFQLSRAEMIGSAKLDLNFSAPASIYQSLGLESLFSNFY